MDNLDVSERASIPLVLVGDHLHSHNIIIYNFHSRAVSAIGGTLLSGFNLNTFLCMNCFDFSLKFKFDFLLWVLLDLPVLTGIGTAKI